MGGAQAVAPDHARHHFLAGAGFAFDDHGGVGGRDARDHLVNLHHGRRVADHLGFRHLFAGGLAALVAAGGLGALDGVDHHIQIEGLSDIVERAAAGGGHHGLHGAAAGHQNHCAERVAEAGGFQHVQSGAFIHVNIGDHDGVRFARVQPIERVAGGGNGVHQIPLRLERRLNGELQRRIVFH